MRSVAGILSPEAYEKGIQAGVEKGEAKGRGQNARIVLLNLITAKFGPLNEKHSEKLKMLKDADTLNGLCVSLLTVNTIDEFMATVDNLLDA